MPYTCPICQTSMSDDLKQYVNHTEEHIVDVIKKDHPGWIQGSGICPKCLEYYHGQIKGDNS